MKSDRSVLEPLAAVTVSPPAARTLPDGFRHIGWAVADRSAISVPGMAQERPAVGGGGSPKPSERTPWLPRIASVGRGRSLSLRMFAERCNGGRVHGGITSRAWGDDSEERPAVPRRRP